MNKGKSSSMWKGSFFGSVPSDSAPGSPNSPSSGKSEVDANVVAAADEAEEGKVGEGTGKIKFKKAKKLTKKVGVHYTKAMNDMKKSRFDVRNNGFITK